MFFIRQVAHGLNFNRVGRVFLCKLGLFALKTKKNSAFLSVFQDSFIIRK